MLLSYRRERAHHDVLEQLAAIRRQPPGAGRHQHGAHLHHPGRGVSAVPDATPDASVEHGDDGQPRRGAQCRPTVVERRVHVHVERLRLRQPLTVVAPSTGAQSACLLMRTQPCTLAPAPSTLKPHGTAHQQDRNHRHCSFFLQHT